MVWTPFKKSAHHSGDHAAAEAPPIQRQTVHANRVSSPPVSPNGHRKQAAELVRSSLDSIGQRDEIIRQRISVMIDRLEDVQTLQDEFAMIMEPLIGISQELPRATIRIAELENSLAKEITAVNDARQEAVSYTTRVAELRHELDGLAARADRAEADLNSRDGIVEEQRITLRDKTLAVENLERQLFAETEQNKALISENKALRIEAQVADSALSRSEHDLQSTRERVGILDHDNRRLQTLSEEQASRLGNIEARYNELEVTAETERERLRAVEAQLADETAARARAESQYEAEVVAFRTERSSLSMKLEAAVSRAAATEQLLGQVRGHLREKDEAQRIADRNFKEASIARNTAERRLEALQADLARQADRYLEMQRIRAELDARCDMLTKALAAKDATLEQSSSRNAALTERIEHLTGRHEAARAELEAANRRLVEDLQNERSERTLVQGALDIARESRAAIQKQHEALKRSGRNWRSKANDEDVVDKAPEQAAHEVEEVSNVRPFTSPAKPTDAN